ncbi:porin family protein [Algivirga pacifica]|uniref:Outer membrane protein beta-barrel domain-containing protein n=1 Tax=Algivirga pacifica TaxID=1162670 RepID=A0ABP9CWR4_9BACT
MKKLLISVLALFAFSAANAQLHLGARLGGNVAFYNSDVEAENVAPRLFSPNIGVVAEVRIARFGVQAEVQYSQQGLDVNGAKTGVDLSALSSGVDLTDPSAIAAFASQYPNLATQLASGAELPAGEVSTEGTQRRDYLNIPVMAKLHLPLGIKIFAGPQFGLPLSAVNDYKNTLSLNKGESFVNAVMENPSLQSEVVQFAEANGYGPQVQGLLGLAQGGEAGVEVETDVKEEVSPLDVSAVIGVGFQIKKLAIDARYANSFTNMYKDVSELASGNTKNAVVQVGLTYFLF